MTCHTCITGGMCDYRFELSHNEAKRVSDLRLAERRERQGGPSAQPQRDALARIRNEIEAHIHGGIPPEEQETHCECCGVRGGQCAPENVNARYSV